MKLDKFISYFGWFVLTIIGSVIVITLIPATIYFLFGVELMGLINYCIAAGIFAIAISIAYCLMAGLSCYFVWKKEQASIK